METNNIAKEAVAQAHTLSKAERIRNLGVIRRLFQGGDSGFVYPLRYMWYRDEAPEVEPAQVLFSVPKKMHKRANKRNLLRRKIKESYRLHKSLLPEDQGYKLAIIYATKQVHTYKTIDHALTKILDKIASHNA